MPQCTNGSSRPPLDKEGEWQQQLRIIFDGIFVLTIVRATQRHEHIASVLKGLEHETFMGVDKNELTPDILAVEYDDLKARAVQRSPRSLYLGEIACALSHRKIYEEIVRRGLQNTLILEDDVVPQNMDSLAAILSEWPADAGIVYLGYWRRDQWHLKQKAKTRLYLIYHALRLGRWHRLQRERVRRYYCHPYSAHFMTSGYHNGSHAYAVTLEAARALSEMQRPVVYLADHLLAYAATADSRCKGYSCKPLLFEQLFRIGNNEYITLR
jgi:glycosyl transferase, family 25